MRASLILCAVLLPILFWAAYHYYHDRHRPEPLGHLLLSLASGAAAFFAASGWYLALNRFGLHHDAYALAAANDYLGLLLYAVAGIGFGEEFCKMLPFLLIVLRFRAFDEPMDGLVYGSFIALGFALAENLSYLSFLSDQQAYARGFAGPLVHIVFASVWAYPTGCAWLSGTRFWGTAALSLGAAALLHGVYDFIAIGFAQNALLAAALIVCAVWVWRLRLMQTLHAAYRVRPP